jgi:hypothetical protein
VSDLDVSALLPLRTTTYRRAPDFWLDVPDVPHRDHQSVPPELGTRIIAGLENLPNGTESRGGS